MDIQSAPPPSATAPNMSVVGVPPQLGAPVPGATGGLPALSGLSIAQNPMAEALRSKGRGDDTMLVHMTPNEVNSLQGLAMAAGGSLTINPETGLPEAGILGKLLPMLLGVGLNFLLPGSGIVASLGGKAATAGLLTAAGTTAITGDLQKGLMAGLGAFGGASLAGGIQGALGGAAKNAATVTPGATPPIAPTPGGALPVPGVSVPPPIDAALVGSPQFVAQQAAQQAATQAATNAPGILSRFGQGFANTAKGTMGGILSKAAVPAAISGVMGSFGSSGGSQAPQGQIDNSYQGPYYSPRRKIVSNVTTEDILKGSGEQQRWFDVGMPEVRNVQGQLVQPGSATAPGTPILQNVLNPNAKKGEPMYMQQYTPFMMSPQEQQMAAMYPSIYGRMGYAEGGEVELSDGAFVVDARTVSELGNGSSGAGQELLAKMGGRPIQGPGDGVSDSIPARIGRDQPARVARDEVLFSPEAVERLGKGSEKRGAQKLYALMDKAHKARRSSARGKDTGLRKGLT